jgi:hypothetical protein
MGRGGDVAGVTTTSENLKAIVGCRRTIKEMVRRIVPSGTTWGRLMRKVAVANTKRGGCWPGGDGDGEAHSSIG